MDLLKTESSEITGSQILMYAKLANKGIKIDEERYTKP
jgi:hypothetical protein